MEFNLVFSSRYSKISKNKVNLFLNENIFYEKKNKNFKYKILEKNFHKSNCRTQNFEKCDIIYKNLINDLGIELNKLHNKNYNIIFWKILLGYWLKKFIYIIFYRFNLMHYAIRKHNISEVTLIESKTNHLASHESKHIEYQSINDDWNAILLSKIYNNFYNGNEKKIYLKKSKKRNFYEKKKLKKKLSIRSILETFLSILNFFYKQTDPIIIDTYMEKKDLIKLFFINKCIPKKYLFKDYEFKNIDLNLRKNFSIKKKKVSNIEALIRELLPEYLPTFVMESFDSLEKNVCNLNMPKKPRFIFTSNAFQFNETFKFYVGKIKQDLNFKNYFIGQHGNNYMTKIDNDYLNELDTSDKFFIWGKKKNNFKKFVSTFNFTLRQKKIKKNINSKNLLFVFKSLGYQALPYNRFVENKIEFVKANFLIKKLPINIRQNILIRFHYSFGKRYNNFCKKILLKLSPYNKNFGKSNLYKLINDTRAIVFCYDSTGMYHFFHSQIPVICLMPNFNHLKKDVINDFVKLKKAGIIFNSASEASKHIVKNWNKMDDWWMSHKVRKAIKNFNFKYNLNRNNSSIKNFSKLLNKNKINF